VIIADFLHQRFGKRNEARLGGAICGAAGEKVSTCEAADIDDVPAAAFLHERNGFVAAVEQSREVGVDRGAPGVRRHVFHTAEIADSGIVDQEIEAAKPLRHLLHHRPYLVISADVAHRARNAITMCGFHRGDSLVDPRLIPSADENGEVVIQKGFGNRPADATGRTRNYR
jgi:hypothetical protein